MHFLAAVVAASLAVQAGAQSLPEGESDFAPELVQRAAFEESAFTAPLEVTLDSPVVKVSAHSLETDPFLGTLPNSGQSQVLFELQPCGAIAPHVHPRGTETLLVFEGSVMAGVIEENGGRIITSNLTVGDTFTMPQGLMHFHQNLECKPARYYGVLDNRDPGLQTIVPNLLRAPLSVLRNALGVDDETIAKLQAAAMAPPVQIRIALRAAVRLAAGMATDVAAGAG